MRHCLKNGSKQTKGQKKQIGLIKDKKNIILILFSVAFKILKHIIVTNITC